MKSHSVTEEVSRSEREVILLFRRTVVEGIESVGGSRDDECRESLVRKKSWTVEICVDHS